MIFLLSTVVFIHFAGHHGWASCCGWRPKNGFDSGQYRKWCRIINRAEHFFCGGVTSQVVAIRQKSYIFVTKKLLHD